MAIPAIVQDRSGGPGIAVVQWSQPDGMAEVLAAALVELGREPLLFHHTAAIPAAASIVFSFAPFGNYMALAERIAAIEPQARPALIHWNTEPLPDLRLPWPLVYPVSRLRSWLGLAAIRSRLDDKPPLAALQSRMMRFRSVGDYHDTYRRGILSVLADCSAVYADLHQRHGLPAVYAPWGQAPAWHRDLGLERDIDVLWLGRRATRRRSRILDRVRSELRRQGVEVYVVDHIEHPPVYGEDRTELLNRTKIVLNLNRGWGDNTLFRFSLVAPNGAMMVSELMLPHCPEYEPGVHYVSTPVEQLSSTILHYLRHDEQRQVISDNARRLFAQEKLSLKHQVYRLVAQAEAVYQGRREQAPARQMHGASAYS